VPAVSEARLSRRNVAPQPNHSAYISSAVALTCQHTPASCQLYQRPASATLSSAVALTCIRGPLQLNHSADILFGCGADISAKACLLPSVSEAPLASNKPSVTPLTLTLTLVAMTVTGLITLPTFSSAVALTYQRKPASCPQHPSHACADSSASLPKADLD
jgi:hypothetical protein